MKGLPVLMIAMLLLITAGCGDSGDAPVPQKSMDAGMPPHPPITEDLMAQDVPTIAPPDGPGFLRSQPLPEQPLTLLPEPTP